MGLLGNKPSATRPLTENEVEKLYDSGCYLGNDSPIALLYNVIWWKITVSFGYRARGESRKLKFGDVKLLQDENGASLWVKREVARHALGKEASCINAVLIPVYLPLVENDTRFVLMKNSHITTLVTFVKTILRSF